MPRRELWAVYQGDLFYCQCDDEATAMKEVGGCFTARRFVEVLPDGDDCEYCEGTGKEGPNTVFTVETCQCCGVRFRPSEGHDCSKSKG